MFEKNESSSFLARNHGYLKICHRIINRKYERSDQKYDSRNKNEIIEENKNNAKIGIKELKGYGRPGLRNEN